MGLEKLSFPSCLVYVTKCGHTFNTSLQHSLVFVLFFFQDDEIIDAEIEKSFAPRIVCVGRLANLNPVYIVAEGMIVSKLCNLSMGMSIALLLGCYYIFNMKYPSTSKNIFIFLEAIMLNNGSKAKKRVAINKFFKELS